MSVISIPKLFESIAEAVNVALSSRAVDPFPVYFDYGHYNEVVKNLTEKDGSITQKDNKYPLIWLVMDFVEKFGINETGYCSLPDLQILIVTDTKVNMTTRERIEQVFIPKLYPIYEELKYQIIYSGLFTNMTEDTIDHEKIDRPYWGGQDSNGNGTANLFNDHVDAVQLRRLKLEVDPVACDQFKLL